MTEQAESTAIPASPPDTQAEHVLMIVPHDHPLLTLKRALPWQEIEQVMKRVSETLLSQIEYWLKTGRVAAGKTEQGLFKRIWQTLLGLLHAAGESDLSKGSLDGSFVTRQKGGELVDRGAKGNGSTLMVASEAHGIPVAYFLAQSSTHESQLARDTLAEARVPQVDRGRPMTRILEIAMDRAFDARELRRDLRKRGIRSSIPERKRRGKRRQKGPRPKQYPVSKERYKVERANAWFRAERD